MHAATFVRALNPAKMRDDLEAKWIQNEMRDLQHSPGPYFQFDTAAGTGVQIQSKERARWCHCRCLENGGMMSSRKRTVLSLYKAKNGEFVIAP